jgi:hypothetical protein
VEAALWAGAELVPAERVGVAEDRGPRDEDDDGPDGEAVVDEADDSELWPPVAVAWAGDLWAALVAGAVVVGDDGADGVVPRCEDAMLSSPMVVVPDEGELPTSADTGFCPMSSIPVTMPIATTKTATA